MEYNLAWASVSPRKTLRWLSVIALAVTMPIFYTASGQIAPPQLNLSGNVGAQGFPLLNSGTLVFASDSNHTMTAQESSATGGIKITSGVTLTAARNLILPTAFGKLQFVQIENATTGGQSIIVIGQSGTGITIPNGQIATGVWFDGTNVNGTLPSSGAVSSVSNSDSSLTVSPTTGAVVASLNTAHANTWTAPQTFSGSGPALKIPASVAATGSSGNLSLGADANSRLLQNPNNTGALLTPGVASAQPAGNCVEWASNGIDLTNAGVTCTGGFSAQIKYVSQLAGCFGDTDLNAGGGHDDTNCINTALATATATTPVILWQDKASLISGGGIHGPAGGNWAIVGNGGGVTKLVITSCTVAGGIATFATQPNTLIAGQVGTLSGLTTGACAAITNTTVTVLSSGLTSTQFRVSAAGSQSTVAENAEFVQAYGTGFFFATGSSGDVISNGLFFSAGNCGISPGTPGQQGSNILLKDFILNGNANGQGGNYCFGGHLVNVNEFTIDNVTFYNSAHFSLTCDNCSNGVIHGSTFFSSSDPVGTQTDGIHLDGPAADIRISDSYFKTGDDAIALNAFEGYCGPISRVTITNSTLDNSYSALRAYNLDLNACGNGLIPLIDTVDIDNYSGTIADHPVTMGAGITESGTLSPAITNLHWNNSTLTAPNPSNEAFLVSDNIGDISFSNFTIKSPTNGSIFRFYNLASGHQTIGNIKLSNFQVVETAAGHIFQHLFDFGNAGNTVQSISVSGFGVSQQGGSYSPVTCLFCWGGMASTTIGQTAVDNIDSTFIATLFDPGGGPNTIIPSIYQKVLPLVAMTSVDGLTQNLPAHLALGNTHQGSAGTFDAHDGFRVNGAAPSGHCLVGDGSHYTDGACGSFNGGTITNPLVITPGAHSPLYLGAGTQVDLGSDGSMEMIPSGTGVAGGAFIANHDNDLDSMSWLHSSDLTKGFSIELASLTGPMYFLDRAAGMVHAIDIASGAGNPVTFNKPVSLVSGSTTVPLSVSTALGGPALILGGSSSLAATNLQASGTAIAGTYAPIIIYSAAGTPLPSCVSGLKGYETVVSDATSPTYLGTYTSGGSVVAPVMCNGTSWITY